MTHDLIPRDELLPHGVQQKASFVDGGAPFMYNCLIAQCALQPHSAVLDMGCDTGIHARALTKYLSKDGKYCGFDVLRAPIEWCQQAYAHLPNFRFDWADVYSDWYNKDSQNRAENYKFPYDDATFDVIYAVSLFTHIQPAIAENYIREARRVLKPGGRLLFSCFLINEFNGGKNSGSYRVDEYMRPFVRVSKIHHEIDVEKPSLAVGYDEIGMRQMVINSGLEVSQVTFGRWANTVDVLRAGQDMIIGTKPQ